MIHVGGVPEHFNLPWHLGIEQGLFAQAGLDLRFHEYPTGTGAMCADLKAGKLDLIVALTEGLISDIAKDQQIQILAPYVLSPLRWGIYVAQDSDYHQSEQLKDQTFAISRKGSGSHLMAMLWGAQYAWPANTMNFAEVGGLDQLESAVLSHECGAFLWEVFTTLPRVKAGSLRKIAEFPSPWPCFMIAAPAELSESQKQAYQLVLNTLYSITQQATQNHAHTIAEISKRYHLSQAEAQDWFNNLTWAQTPKLPFQALDTCKQNLQELGLIKPS